MPRVHTYFSERNDSLILLMIFITFVALHWNEIIHNKDKVIQKER